jgi:hypothetical protein
MNVRLSQCRCGGEGGVNRRITWAAVRLNLRVEQPMDRQREFWLEEKQGDRFSASSRTRLRFSFFVLRHWNACSVRWVREGGRRRNPIAF